MTDIKWQDLCAGKKFLYGTEENLGKSKIAQRQREEQWIKRQDFIDTNKKPEPKDTVETLYKKLGK